MFANHEIRDAKQLKLDLQKQVIRDATRIIEHVVCLTSPCLYVCIHLGRWREFE